MQSVGSPLASATSIRRRGPNTLTLFTHADYSSGLPPSENHRVAFWVQWDSSVAAIAVVIMLAGVYDQGVE